MSRRESITIIRPGAPTEQYDEQGSPVVGPDVETVSDGWLVAPRSSGESAEPFGQQVITGLSISCRAQVDIRSSDRVNVRGDVFAVDGDIASWHSGTVVNLERAG